MTPFARECCKARMLSGTPGGFESYYKLTTEYGERGCDAPREPTNHWKAPPSHNGSAGVFLTYSIRSPIKIRRRRVESLQDQSGRVGECKRGRSETTSGSHRAC